MAEDVARAVGASGPNVVMIAGKECRPRPLTIKELTELERICLAQYKHEYLKTYSENIEFIPEQERTQILREKLDECAKWDLTDLPKKFAYDASSILLTEEIENWLRNNSFNENDWPAAVLAVVKKRIITAYLDSGELSESEYVDMAKSKPNKSHVNYASWWITGTYEGMLNMVWLAFKDYFTKDEIALEVSKNMNLLQNVSREIESLTVPQVGNG